MKQLNWYQIFGKSNIPDGRTVEPTDDIQIWLNCADIWDKAYTKLAEVLADTATLSALMASDNAVDYLVRSTSWAVSVSVPTMTSNTTPSGVCIRSNVYSSTYEAYKAFDNDDSTRWAAQTTAVGNYCGYIFSSAEIIDVVEYKTSADINYTAQLKGSNDGVTWTDIGSTFSISANESKTLRFDNSTAYTHYAVFATTAGNQSFIKLQFYSASITADSTAMTLIGANNYAANTLLADATWCEAICESEYFESVLNVKVPKMTSNTAPEGEVIYSGNGTDAYKAFDRDTSTYWGAGTSTMPQYLGYIFTSSVSIYLMSVTNRNSSPIRAIKDFKLQSSADNITWSDEETFSNSNDTAFYKANYINYDGSNKSGWRVYITSAFDGNISMIAELQFYGREDV